MAHDRSRHPGIHESPDRANASAVSGMTIMNVRDIHLRSTRDEEWKPPGKLATVYGFAAIALLILLIACINFMNLATARSATARARGRRAQVARRDAGAVDRAVSRRVGRDGCARDAARDRARRARAARFQRASSAPISSSTYFGAEAWRFELLALIVIVGIARGQLSRLLLCPRSSPRRFSKGTSCAARREHVPRRARRRAVRDRDRAADWHGRRLSADRFARTLDLGFDKDQIVVLTASAGAGSGLDWQPLKDELLAHAGIVGVTASHYTPFSFDDNTLRSCRATKAAPRSTASSSWSWTTTSSRRIGSRCSPVACSRANSAATCLSAGAETADTVPTVYVHQRSRRPNSR